MLYLNFELVCAIIVILYIWFDTDAFPEWAELFHLKWFKYKKYQEEKRSAIGSMFGFYSDFLLFKYGSHKFFPFAFFIRGATCPICFAVWLNLIGIYFLQNHIGGFDGIGCNVIATWIGYFGLKKILFKLNE